MRSRTLVRRKLLDRPVSAATVALPAAPLQKIPPLLFSLGIAGEARIRLQRPQNLPGGFALAHLNQVAASSVLLLEDVRNIATSGSDCQRLFSRAGAQPAWAGNPGCKWKKHAIGFEAEPEKELAVQAQ